MAFAEIIAGVLEVDSSAVIDDAGPVTLPAWTSLRHLELVVALEEHYQVSFSYREIRDVKSIAELRNVLRNKGIDV